MKVIFIVYNDFSPEQRSELAQAGFVLEDGFTHVNIEETEANRSILKRVDEWGLQKFVGTLYDKNDLKKASLFVYWGAWAFGYPQPEGDFGYKGLTYDISNYCEECGVGAIQKAPFHIRRQPAWGKKKLGGLNWVHDEIFVNKELYEKVFKNHGIEIRPVLQYKKNIQLEDVFQLVIPIVDASVKLDEYEYEVCKTCGRKKYTPQVKGLAPGFVGNTPNLKLFKTREYFGSGARGYNRTFMDRSLYHAILKAGGKLRVAPVE